MLPYRLTYHPVVRALRRPVKMVQGFIACAAFGFPSRHIRVVGVTGTTGKTSAIELIAVALESAGYTVGTVSSIHIKVGTKVETNTTGLTAVNAWRLQKLLAHMVRSGCHYAVVELSSHALDQHRMHGTMFDVAVLTNFERDHLDYHQTLEDYARAKQRLFATVSKREKKMIGGKYVPRVFVVQEGKHTETFLREPADTKIVFSAAASLSSPTPSRMRVTATSVQHGPEKTTAIVTAGNETALLHLRLAGLFNVENALCAVGVGMSQSIPLAQMTRELYEVRAIPGRFERIEHGQPFTAIIDYAVTEAALRAFFAAVEELKPKRILAVFGACGNRDRGKRANMAAIVAKHADIIFLTNEDPFTEDPEQIFADLEKGFVDARCSAIPLSALTGSATFPSSVYVKIPDRRDAIRAALTVARPGDVVVATGKGVEATMRFHNYTVPWNERQVVEEEIRRLTP